MPPALPLQLAAHSKLFVHQIREVAELLGFETRNKYEILGEHREPVGFAAEQQKGFLGWLSRQLLGHWRRFDILLFDSQRNPTIKIHHPFRILFQRLEIETTDGERLGAIQQRFGIFSKKLDVIDSSGQVILKVSSPLFRIWTFPFMAGNFEMASVKKQWGGILAESFTDKDTFLVEYHSELATEARLLVLCASLFIDLVYFEKKAGN